MKKYVKHPYFAMVCLLITMVVTALLCSNDMKTMWYGLLEIYKSPDILITDYIELAGLSAAFLNASITGGVFILLLCLVKHNPDRKTIMAFWLVCGFSLFGKNIVTISPILFGGFLYSKFAKEPYRENIVTSFLGTGLAPAIMQIYYLSSFHNLGGILISIALGVLIGFVLLPVTKYTAKLSSGHNLYNSGFSAGLVAMLIMAFFRGAGINFTTNSIWSSGNDTVIVTFLFTVSLELIVIGMILSSDIKVLIKKVICDLYKKSNNIEKEETSFLYLNMGFLGIFCGIFVWIMEVEFSGPILGAIFTIIGFGSCGKNIKYIFPIMLGGLFASMATVYELNNPSVVIAVLFSTCLAPIVRDYGMRWGFVAGMLHVTFVMSSGDFYGGINLYNNGLAGGFVAIILVPIIEAINKRKKSHGV